MTFPSAWMDDELALLEAQAARFIERELKPHAQDWERDRQVGQLAWRKAGEAGLLCAAIPEEYGGGGGSRAHEAVIARAFIRAGLGGGLGTGNGVSSGLVAHYIHAYGSEEQKRRWLQLHGGYGYMSEYPIARLWADARAARIYGGTSEIMKTIIARSL